MIYKILREIEWQSLLSMGVFKGSVDDIRDGFIHLSTRDQVPGTLQKYFGDHDSVWLIPVDPGRLPGDALKYEESRGGDKFPHLYADLPLDACEKPYRLAQKGDRWQGLEDALS